MYWEAIGTKYREQLHLAVVSDNKNTIRNILVLMDNVKVLLYREGPKGRRTQIYLRTTRSKKEVADRVTKAVDKFVNQKPLEQTAVRS